jgi:hypothetical protein
MKHELSNVSSQYGAPMGRTETHGDKSQPVHFKLIQLQWEDSDYDTGGAYWGGGYGEHIYHALGEQNDNSVELFVRGKSFTDAESKLLADYPLATFERHEQETDAKLFWFSTGSGRIELQMTMAQAESMSHSGSCDADVSANRQLPSIASQLSAIDPALLRAELREYGWDAADLQDHEANLDIILWLAACDIKENGEYSEEE